MLREYPYIPWGERDTGHPGKWWETETGTGSFHKLWSGGGDYWPL